MDGTLLPCVSVIVPVFNGRATIGMCLDSLQTINYPPDKLEIIIVDNNSTDGTTEIVKEYPFTLLYETEIQSSYAARDKGSRSAKGEFLLFTDADCIVEPDWVMNIILPFAAPEVAAAAGKIISVKGDTLIEDFVTEADPLGVHTLGGMLSLVTANVAYRRSVFEQMGGFNCYMTTGADLVLGWNVQQAIGIKVEYVENAIVYHKHRTTITGMRRQFRRYGSSEIILDTMFRKQDFYPRKPYRQLIIMAFQFGSLLIYIAAMISHRFKATLRHTKDEKYLAWPGLWFAAESSNLEGKMRAIWQTRFFSRDPFKDCRK